MFDSASVNSCEKKRNIDEKRLAVAGPKKCISGDADGWDTPSHSWSAATAAGNFLKLFGQ
jgi:hypothetical protein